MGNNTSLPEKATNEKIPNAKMMVKRIVIR